MHDPASLPRRDLLRLLATAGLVLPAASCASGWFARRDPDLRISLAEWSLHRKLFAGEVDHLDFPKIARERYDIGGIEYVNTFFKEHAEDQAYLQAMKDAADRHGVRSLLIMVDGEGNLGGSEADKAVANHHKWIRAAHFLGCHSIRVNAGGDGTPEEVAARASASLRSLAEYGAPLGINVIVENPGGSSSNGTWLAGVIEGAEHPGVGTLPDFGNFRISATESYDRYKGVEELMPFAKAVSAKSHEFDEAGNEAHIDFARMLEIVRAAGYRGYIGIEYEGSGLDEFEGIAKTKPY
ncbi:MAG: TIM barrel protein [Planctomycetota bacterium]